MTSLTSQDNNLFFRTNYVSRVNHENYFFFFNDTATTEIYTPPQLRAARTLNNVIDSQQGFHQYGLAHFARLVLNCMIIIL